MRDQHDYGEYVKAWRERLAKQEREKQQRVQRLRQVAQACACRLVQDFGASKVYLFGSLLEEGLVHDRSDIDLAVEGLDGRLYLSLARFVGAVASRSRTGSGASGTSLAKPG